ncbi:MAG: hypothetical protein M0C28_18720 [Candidatus Moduliflexus flocculans]|nr:hypothetical protein [Candidatus Moduliflexus flocculans]
MKEDKAFFVKGTPIPDGYTGLIAGTISDVEDAVARPYAPGDRHGASRGADDGTSSTSTQIQYREHLKDNQKPVKIFVHGESAQALPVAVAPQLLDLRQVRHADEPLRHHLRRNPRPRQETALAAGMTKSEPAAQDVGKLPLLRRISSCAPRRISSSGSRSRSDMRSWASRSTPWRMSNMGRVRDPGVDGTLRRQRLLRRLFGQVQHVGTSASCRSARSSRSPSRGRSSRPPPNANSSRHLTCPWNRGRGRKRPRGGIRGETLRQAQRRHPHPFQVLPASATRRFRARTTRTSRRFYPECIPCAARCCRPAKKILLCVTTVSIATLFFLNLFTRTPGEQWWSPILSIGAILYFWLSVRLRDPGRSRTWRSASPS